MPTYQNPGVYVSEAAFVSKPKSSNTSRSTAAFFGEASRGPSTATLVTSWSDYRTLYGDLSQTSDLGFAVYHYFSNGGKDAYVVRVTSTSAAAAAITVPYYPNGTGSASAVLFTADAISKGVWGNDLTVEFTAGSTAATASVIPTFNLLIKLSGVEVERWNDLSPEISSNRYFVTILNTYSSYIDNVVVGGAVAAETADASWAYKSTATAFTLGVAGSATQDSDYTAALSQLDSVEGVLILNAVNKTSTSVVNAFIDKAQSVC